MDSSMTLPGKLILSFLTAILSGLVLTLLWGWFLVPLGVRAIGIAHAFGIALVTGFLTYRMDAPTKDHTFTERLSTVIGYDLMILGLGFLAHLCM